MADIAWSSYIATVSVAMMRDSSTAEVVPGTKQDIRRTQCRKQHPAFETWVSGSPHDSDEYSTDLEEGDAKTGRWTSNTFFFNRF